MTDLKSMTLEEITAALRAMGEPSFRGKQVFTWLHRGITDFDEMMNIPKSLREKLRAEYYITVPTVARKQVSKLDGTIHCRSDRWCHGAHGPFRQHRALRRPGIPLFRCGW